MRTCPRCGKSYEDDQAFCSKDGSTLTTHSGSTPSKIPTGSGEHSGPNSRLLPLGSVIGNYRLNSVLGKGGMGIVYGAEHTRLGRKVAFKVLRAEFIEDPVTVQRFFHEARAAHTVGHENIVEVFDFIETGDIRGYVMELLEGKPLQKELAGETPLALSRVYRIGRQVADALSAVHDKGIIHRDLKPDNIYLTTRRRESDFVKLLDFGVAKLIESNTDEHLKTQTGMVLGTPAYMSPEQLKGEDIDRRTDIYAFGVILYQLVTGRRPFKAKTIPELMLKHVSEPPVPPSKVPGLPHAIPRALEELILRCLEKERDRRPNDMHEIEMRFEGLEAEALANEGVVEADDDDVLLFDGPGFGLGPAPAEPPKTVPSGAEAPSSEMRSWEGPAGVVSPAAHQAREDPLMTPSPATRSGLMEAQAALDEASNIDRLEREARAFAGTRKRALLAATLTVVLVGAAGALYAVTRGGAPGDDAPDEVATGPASRSAAPAQAVAVVAPEVPAAALVTPDVPAAADGKLVTTPPEAKPDAKPEAKAALTQPTKPAAAAKPVAKPKPKPKPAPAPRDKEKPLDPFAK